MTGMTGIILAGGQSRRMGRDKALLPWGGTTFLGEITDALQGLFTELLVVSNHLPEPLPGTSLVRDTYSAQGPLAGIHAGLSFTKTNHAFVCACDMPYINAAGIAPLLRAAQEIEDWQVIMPEDERGPEPLLACYAKSCLPVIQDLLDRGKPRILDIVPYLRVHRLSKALFVEPDLFRNINTPGEYSNALGDLGLENAAQVSTAPNKKDQNKAEFNMSVNLDQARQILLKATPVLSEERVSLDNSWRRVLAEDIVAPLDYPRFDRSPLDGYALKSGEVKQATKDAPVILRITSVTYAGDAAGKELEPGTAARITTGAPLPPGADGVVRQEDTEQRGDQVYIYAGKGAEKNVSRQGEDISKGNKALSRGALVDARVISVLAALGQDQPLVHKQPRVAVVSIGSELAPVGAQLGPGMIYNSNIHMVNALVRDALAAPVHNAVVEDEESAIASTLLQAPDCDLYITTGGASIGDKDLTEKVLRSIGVDIFFTRVNIKPGMPVMGGIKDGRMYIGLSGNPSAAGVAFEMIARPALLRMGGHLDLARKKARAVLSNYYPKSTSTPRYLWARYSLTKQGFTVEALTGQGNGMLSAGVRANALLTIPENSPPQKPGDEVEILILDSYL